MKVRHCWQVQNNQEKNILSEEMNSRSLEEYEPCCTDASKKKNIIKMVHGDLICI